MKQLKRPGVPSLTSLRAADCSKTLSPLLWLFSPICRTSFWSDSNAADSIFLTANLTWGPSEVSGQAKAELKNIGFIAARLQLLPVGKDPSTRYSDLQPKRSASVGFALANWEWSTTNKIIIEVGSDIFYQGSSVQCRWVKFWQITIVLFPRLSTAHIKIKIIFTLIN